MKASVPILIGVAMLAMASSARASESAATYIQCDGASNATDYNNILSVRRETKYYKVEAGRLFVLDNQGPYPTNWVNLDPTTYSTPTSIVIQWDNADYTAGYKIQLDRVAGKISQSSYARNATKQLSKYKFDGDCRSIPDPAVPKF